MAGLFEKLASILGGTEPVLAEPVDAPARSQPDVAADDPRLPDSARPGVARLLALAADVEARGARDPLLSAAVTEVRQMRDQHLPQLVASYADIPPAHRAEIFRATGKSASYKLDEAIDRMIAKAEGLSRSLAQEDIDSFDDTLRFINQRYGSSQDPLI